SLLQEHCDPVLGISIRAGTEPFHHLPYLPECWVIGMKGEGPGHGTDRCARGVGHLHDSTPVELALRRAVPVDRAADQVSVRAEEPAGGRVAFRERGIREEVALVRVNLCRERCIRRDRAAIEREWAGLALDHDIIAKVHAARTAL